MRKPQRSCPLEVSRCDSGSGQHSPCTALQLQRGQRGKHIEPMLGLPMSEFCRRVPLEQNHLLYGINVKVSF